jgi:hypothetical protein
MDRSTSHLSYMTHGVAPAAGMERYGTCMCRWGNEQTKPNISATYCECCWTLVAALATQSGWQTEGCLWGYELRVVDLTPKVTEARSGTTSR